MSVLPVKRTGYINGDLTIMKKLHYDEDLDVYIVDIISAKGSGKKKMKELRFNALNRGDEALVSDMWRAMTKKCSEELYEEAYMIINRVNSAEKLYYGGFGLKNIIDL